MPTDDSGGGGNRSSLKKLVEGWNALDKLIKDYPGADLNTPHFQSLKKDRRELADQVVAYVEKHPKMWDAAVNMGFNSAILDDRASIDTDGDGIDDTADSKPNDPNNGGGGGGGHGCPAGYKWSEKQKKCLKITGGGDDETTPDDDEETTPGGGIHKKAVDNRLLGDLGTDYVIVQGPKGTYVAKYRYEIGGEIFEGGLKLGRGADVLKKYGFKTSDVKQLTKAQMRRIEDLGDADDIATHIRKGDSSLFDALVRSLDLQYEGQSILNHKGVMKVVIQNSIFGWTAGEFQNQLRNTGWYKNTDEAQRDWQTVMSPKTRKNATDRTLELVVNELEDAYGLKWTQMVGGGMTKAREIAEKIASGQMGEAGVGFELWRNRMLDRASLIENTPEWLRRQAEEADINAQLNKPEQILESLRSQAMDYLGESNGKPLIDGTTLKRWAADINAGTSSEADWAQFLRQQMRSLHPYFDENYSFTSQASSYKSMAESLTGTTLAWDDPVLMKIQGTDPNGKPTGSAMALYDYAQWIRDNDPRFWSNPQTENKGLGFLSELSYRMTGAK